MDKNDYQKRIKSVLRFQEAQLKHIRKELGKTKQQIRNAEDMLNVQKEILYKFPQEEQEHVLTELDGPEYWIRNTNDQLKLYKKALYEQEQSQLKTIRAIKRSKRFLKRFIQKLNMD